MAALRAKLPAPCSFSMMTLQRLARNRCGNVLASRLFAGPVAFFWMSLENGGVGGWGQEACLKGLPKKGVWNSPASINAGVLIALKVPDTFFWDSPQSGNAISLLFTRICVEELSQNGDRHRPVLLRHGNLFGSGPEPVPILRKCQRSMGQVAGVVCARTSYTWLKYSPEPTNWAIASSSRMPLRKAAVQAARPALSAGRCRKR